MTGLLEKKQVGESDIPLGSSVVMYGCESWTFKKARRESNTLGENEMIHQLDYLTTHSFIYLNIC